MQALQDRSDVITLTTHTDDPSCRVLDELQLAQVL